MSDLLHFFRHEFFPGLLTVIDSIFINVLDIKLTSTQLTVIGIVMVLILISLVIDFMKKVLPLIIIIFLIFYFIYGDLSFIENIINTLGI